MIETDPELLKRSLSCGSEDPLVTDVNVFCIQSSRGDRYQSTGSIVSSAPWWGLLLPHLSTSSFKWGGGKWFFSKIQYHIPGIIKTNPWKASQLIADHICWKDWISWQGFSHPWKKHIPEEKHKPSFQKNL